MSGWWDGNGTISGCVAAYQPIGAADLAASYSNKANPGTYDLSVKGGYAAPGFSSASGWTYSASGKILTTGITNPGAGWSAIARVVYNAGQNGFAVGIWVGWGVGYWSGNNSWIYAGGNYSFGGELRARCVAQEANQRGGHQNREESDKHPRRSLGELPDYSALKNHRVAVCLL